MTRFLLRFAALLLPLSLIAAPAAAQVLVQRPGTGEEMMVLAIMATGSDADKARFTQAAKDRGYYAGDSKNAAGEHEIMVVIRANTPPAPFLQFYKEARAGKFGALSFDIAITPWALVKSGAEFLDATRVFDGENVRMPGE